MRNYTITELLRAIERLPATMPHSDRLEKSGYATHQDHWTTWLGQYNNSDGGYYGRGDTSITDAKTVYQRLCCGEMICWLNEAAGESPILIKMTIIKMAREERAQTKAKIARDAHPWERAAALLFRT